MAAGENAEGKTATFSIVAVDPEAGICGAAVASKYPAVGRVVPLKAKDYRTREAGERAG